MSAITITEEVVPNWTFGGSTATLRIYATKTFVTNDGKTILAGSSSALYKPIVCSVDGNELTIPQFALDSTTNSSVPTARYVGDIYDANGRLRTRFIDAFKLPIALGSPISWDQIREFNATPTPPSGPSYYSADQVDSLLATKQNALVSGTNVKTINGQSLLGGGNLTIEGGGTEVLLSNYASLQAAITAIGSTPATLVVDTNKTLNIPLTIPANVELVRSNKSAITLSGIGAIAFAGRGIDGRDSGLFIYSSISGRVWPNHTSVDASANSIMSANHGLTTGQQVRLTAYKWGGGPVVLPGGLSEGGLYYAIVTSSSVFKLATSYANALAGTAIDITNVGSGDNGFFILPTPIAWTGVDYPQEIFSDVLSDGSPSNSAIIQHLSNSFIGRGVMIDVKPGTFTGTTLLLGDKHSVKLLPGTHQNTFAGSGPGLNFDPFNTCIVLGSDAEFTAEPGAIMMESSVNYYTAIVHIRPGARNSSIHHNHFKSQGAAFDGLDAAARIDSGFNNHIHDNYFEDCQSYVCSIVPGSNGDLPQYSSIRNNRITGCLSQVLFIGGGEFCDILDNEVITRNLVQTSSFVFIDLEPNSDLNVIKDCRINRNRLDYRGVTNAGVLFGFINVNTADTSGFERIQISDNDFIANDPTGTQNSLVYGGVNVYGTDQFEVSNNRFHGIGINGPAIGLYYCRRGRVFGNTAINGSGKIDIYGGVEIAVHDNKFIPVSGNGATQAASISEANFGRYPILSITGAVCRLSYTIFDGGTYFGNLHRHFKGVRAFINSNQYTISSIVPGTIGGDVNTEATMTATVSEPTAPIVVPAADINTTNNTFTKTSHGLNNLACVQYNGNAGGLSGTGIYFVIRDDANTYRLATSYANAVAGIAVDITSQGSGNHTVNLCITIFSYGNRFSNNDCPDGVTLGPLTTSADITPALTNVETISGEVTLRTIDAGTTYENGGATSPLRCVLPSNPLPGKAYNFYVVETIGVTIYATGGKAIRDGASVSAANGIIYSTVVGSAIQLRYIDGQWVVTSKNGTWVMPDFGSATVVARIDCGRTSGGSVGGWAQDTGFTGGSTGSWPGAPLAWDQSNVPTPPTDAVYDTFRSGAFQYDFAGLNNAKDHVVRIHVGTNDVSAGTGYYVYDVEINDVVYVDNIAIQTKLSNLVGYVITLPVAAGASSIKVEMPTALGNYINGIELFEMP